MREEIILKIYMIEDDREICEALSVLLAQYGYDPVCCEMENLKNAARDVKRHAPDLILLDILLPYKDGYTICRELREETGIPIIMLTGQSSEMEEVMSLRSGADDFVAKPYHPQVLIAHIEAVLKRSAAADRNTITVGDVTLDRTAGILYFQASETQEQPAPPEPVCVELTRNELRILNLLMGQRGRIVSRDEIMEELWRDGQFVDENTLNVNMVRLRRRLEAAGIRDFIKTRRGMGYQI